MGVAPPSLTGVECHVQAQGASWSFATDVQQVLPIGDASQALWGLAAATIPGTPDQNLLSLAPATVSPSPLAATVPAALSAAMVPPALPAAAIQSALSAVPLSPAQGDAVSLGIPLGAWGFLPTSALAT